MPVFPSHDALPAPAAGFSWTPMPWGHALVCEPLLPYARHVFTAANLTLRTDESEWSALAGAVSVSRERIRLVRQVHGAAVAIARAGDETEWPMPEADAIISDDGTVAVGVRVADCTPIVIGDRTRRAVAVIHAGWRGTMKGIARAGVEALVSTFGSRPSDLVAAIGPCLGPMRGEVGPEVVEAFRDAGHTEEALARWFSDGPRGRPHVNLWTANRDQLEAVGISPGQIYVAELCTRTSPDVFHSYRFAGSEAGRMIALARPSKS